MRDGTIAVNGLLVHTEALRGGSIPSKSSLSWIAAACPVALAVLQSLTPSAMASALGRHYSEVLKALVGLSLGDLLRETEEDVSSTTAMAPVALAAVINKWGGVEDREGGEAKEAMQELMAEVEGIARKVGS